MNIESGTPLIHDTPEDKSLIVSGGNESNILRKPLRVTVNPKILVDVIAQEFDWIRTSQELADELKDHNSDYGRIVYDALCQEIRKSWINNVDDISLRTYKQWYTDAFLMYSPSDLNTSPNRRKPPPGGGLDTGNLYTNFVVGNPVFPELTYKYVESLRHNYKWRGATPNNGLELKVVIIPHEVVPDALEEDGTWYPTIKFDSEQVKRSIPAVNGNISIRPLFEVRLIVSARSGTKLSFEPAYNDFESLFDWSDAPFKDEITHVNRQFSNTTSQLRTTFGPVFSFSKIIETTHSWEEPTTVFSITNNALFQNRNNAVLPIGPPATSEFSSEVGEYANNDYIMLTSPNVNRGFKFGWSFGGDEQTDSSLNSKVVCFEHIAFHLFGSKVVIYIKSKNGKKFKKWKVIQLPIKATDKDNSITYNIYYIGNGSIVIDKSNSDTIQEQKENKDKANTAVSDQSRNIRSVRVTDGTVYSIGDNAVAIQLPFDAGIPQLPNKELLVFTGMVKVFGYTSIETHYKFERLVTSQFMRILSPNFIIPNTGFLPISEELHVPVTFRSVHGDTNNLPDVQYDTKILTLKPDLLQDYDITGKLPSEYLVQPGSGSLIKNVSVEFTWVSKDCKTQIYLQRIQVYWPGKFATRIPNNFQKVIHSDFIESCVCTYGTVEQDSCELTLRNIDKVLNYLYDENEFSILVEIKDQPGGGWRKVFFGYTNLSINRSYIDVSTPQGIRHDSVYTGNKTKSIDMMRISLRGIAYEKCNAISPIWRWDAGGKLHTDALRLIYSKAGFVTDDFEIETPGYPANNPEPGIEDRLPVGSVTNSYLWAIQPPTSYYSLIKKIVSEFSGWRHIFDHENYKIIYDRRPNHFNINDNENSPNLIRYFSTRKSMYAYLNNNPTHIHCHLSYAEGLGRTFVKPLADLVCIIGGYAEKGYPGVIFRSRRDLRDIENINYLPNSRVVWMIVKAATSYNTLKNFADIIAPRMLLKKRYVTFRGDIPIKKVQYHDWIWHSMFGYLCVKKCSINYTDGYAEYLCMRPQINEGDNTLIVYMFEE